MYLTFADESHTEYNMNTILPTCWPTHHRNNPIDQSNIYNMQKWAHSYLATCRCGAPAFRVREHSLVFDV